MQELLPWGLTVAQTAVLGFGLVAILGAWIILKNAVQIAGTALLLILALLMGCLFFVLAGFYVFNAAQ